MLSLHFKNQSVMTETDSRSLEVTSDYFANEGHDSAPTGNWMFPLIFALLVALAPVIYYVIKRHEEYVELQETLTLNIYEENSTESTKNMHSAVDLNDSMG